MKTRAGSREFTPFIIELENQTECLNMLRILQSFMVPSHKGAVAEDIAIHLESAIRNHYNTQVKN